MNGDPLFFMEVTVLDMMPLSTDREKELLAQFESKVQKVRSFVQGVVDGYQTCVYIHGKGGLSKTYSVEECLTYLGKSRVHTNGRLTAKALFDLLQEHHSELHLLEDCESLFRDRTTADVLRGAMDDPSKDRWVHWRVSRNPQRFKFTGGIIFVANNPPPSVDADWKAAFGRGNVCPLSVDDPELEAKARDIAREGYTFKEHRLSPLECMEVAEELLGQSSIGGGLDLRHLIQGFRFKLQDKNGSSEVSWQEMLKIRVSGAVEAAPKGEYVSREQRKQNELALVRTLVHKTPKERLVAWQTETGKSRPALQRRMDDLRQEHARFAHFPRWGWGTSGAEPEQGAGPSPSQN